MARCCVANAGGGGGMGPYHVLDTAEFVRVLHLNVLGTMLCVKHTAHHMVAAGGGSFVGMSSIAGHVPHPWFGAYCVGKAGIEVVGVEPMAPMLARAHERLDTLPRASRDRIELRKGTLERLRLRRRFPLVIAPFNVWMHLYTREDIERGFATVRHHLEPRGRFAFDVLLPDPISLAREPSKRYRGGNVPHPRDGFRYRYSEYFSYDPLAQIETVMMDFEHPDDQGLSFCTPLTQRQFFPAELEALLHYNGFKVQSHTGDFDGAPISAATESQVIIAALR